MSGESIDGCCLTTSDGNRPVGCLLVLAGCWGPEGKWESMMIAAPRRLSFVCGFVLEGAGFVSRLRPFKPIVHTYKTK